MACLDPRVDPAIVMAPELGDAPVLRNIGGRVTDAVVDDLAFIGMAAENVALSVPSTATHVIRRYVVESSTFRL